MSPADSVRVDFPTVLTSFKLTENIRCLALGGPNNMFEWRKQGMVVSNSDVLELTMITGSDGGTYVCNVTNDAGSDSASASVIGMHLINFDILASYLFKISICILLFL